jgi:hypothetical protein
MIARLQALTSTFFTAGSHLWLSAFYYKVIKQAFLYL